MQYTTYARRSTRGSSMCSSKRSIRRSCLAVRRATSSVPSIFLGLSVSHTIRSSRCGAAQNPRTSFGACTLIHSNMHTRTHSRMHMRAHMHTCTCTCTHAHVVNALCSHVCMCACCAHEHARITSASCASILRTRSCSACLPRQCSSRSLPSTKRKASKCARVLEPHPSSDVVYEMPFVHPGR